MNNRFFCMVIVVLLTILPACSLFNSPSQTVKNFNKYVSEGKIDDATKLLSKRVISNMGIDKVKSGLARTTKNIKERGGITSLEIVKEEIIGEVAEVHMIISYGNGSKINEKVQLIKEEGDWKIDISK